MKLRTIAAVAGFAVASLVSPAAHADADKTIGISFPNAGQPVVETLLNFARVRADAMGFKIVLDDPGDDLTKQFSTLDTWIDSKAVDIVFSTIPNSPDVFNSVARRAVEAGIPWVSYAAKIEAESSYLTWDHKEGGYKLGEAAAKWIDANLDGTAKVALLTFESGAWSRERREGIEEALANLAPKATIVARQDAALDASQAAAATDTMLQANPDLNVVLAIMPAGGEGAYQAFRNAGKDNNDAGIFVGDVDGSARSLTLIQQGTMYRASAALDLQAVGEAIPELAQRLLAGEKTEGVLVPYTMITHDNSTEAQRFIEQWK